MLPALLFPPLHEISLPQQVVALHRLRLRRLLLLIHHLLLAHADDILHLLLASLLIDELHSELTGRPTISLLEQGWFLQAAHYCPRILPVQGA